MMTADKAWQHASDLFNLKQYGDAAAAARAGLNAHGDDGRLWQILGVALWLRGDDTEAPAALASLETASALAPLWPTSQRALADCYAGVGKRDLAVFLYRQLLRGDRCPSELLPGIAASLNRLGEYKLALQACRTLTRRRPTYHQGFFGIAFYLNRLGVRPNLLLGPLTRAMDLAPHLLHYRLNLAFVWAEMGRMRTASDLLASVDPESILCPAWLRKMHAIHDRAGDSLRAADCVRQIDRISNGSCPLD